MAHKILCYVPSMHPKTRGWMWLALGPLLASTMFLIDFDDIRAKKTAFATFWIGTTSVQNVVSPFFRFFTPPVPYFTFCA
jgi:hypothetical protein